MKHALPWKVNRKKGIEKKGKGGKKVYVEQETIENDINFTGGIKAKLSELWKAFFCGLHAMREATRPPKPYYSYFTWCGASIISDGKSWWMYNVQDENLNEFIAWKKLM